MTDEQIKLNAEAYADKKAETVANFQRNPVLEDFIAGAHSRDEEIECLAKNYKEEFDAQEEKLDSLRKGFYERGEKLKELMLANNQLRNPWISIEDRLPRIGQPCFLANFDKRRYGYGKFCADDGMVTRWECTEGGSTMIYCLHEVTHWMPIPELEKGE